MREERQLLLDTFRITQEGGAIVDVGVRVTGDQKQELQDRLSEINNEITAEGNAVLEIEM